MMGFVCALAKAVGYRGCEIDCPMNHCPVYIELMKIRGLVPKDRNMVLHPFTLLLKVYKDGRDWFVLQGTNLQEGVAGIGKTIPDALFSLSEVWDSEYCPKCGTKLGKVHSPYEDGKCVGVFCNDCDYKAGDV
jgi:hypothetical protein